MRLLLLADNTMLLLAACAGTGRGRSRKDNTENDEIRGEWKFGMEDKGHKKGRKWSREHPSKEGDDDDHDGNDGRTELDGERSGDELSTARGWRRAAHFRGGDAGASAANACNGGAIVADRDGFASTDRDGFVTPDSYRLV